MKTSFEKYPNLLLKPYTSVGEASEQSASKEHKALIDLGESLLIYIAGILFGEYKNIESINKKVEKALYRCNGRNLSLGHFQGFVRMLFQEMNDSLIHQKLQDSGSFNHAEQFGFIFSLLKKIIDDGVDSGFKERVEKEKKGRSAKKTDLLDFFNTFIQLRNIYAHPKGKAGPKDNPRDWPLNEEYFELVNLSLKQALEEVLSNLQIIKEYPCIRASDKIEDEQKKATFFVESDLKEKEIELNLSSDQLNYLTSGQRYLLTPDQQIFSRLFYNDIPTVDKQIVKEIQKEEKAKQITPHLRQLIRDKLSDDSKIDELEYLVLHDTARSAFISDEKLFEIIDQIRNELNIEADVGTPELPGELFISKKKSNEKITFNPWWLHYFSLVSTIDDEEVKNEKDRIERLDRRIEIRREDLKNLVTRIRKKEEQIRKQKKKIKKEEQNHKQRINDLKDKIKSATTEDREDKLKEDIVNREEINEDREQRYAEKLKKYEQDLEELEAQLEEAEITINKEIEELQNQRQSEYFYSTWGRHRNMWEELNEYIDTLLRENLNNEEIRDANEDDANSELWTNSSNSWQIGNLAHYYWGKIRPTTANLDDLFHIGIWIGRNFKWVPKQILSEELQTALKKPSSVLWTSVNNVRLEKVDSDNRLLSHYNNIIYDFIHRNSEKLLQLSLNVRCNEIDISMDPNDVENYIGSDVFMPLEIYLQNNENYKPTGLYSKIWTLEEFYENGKLKIDCIDDYEKQMQTLISLFSNIIARHNEYAIEEGVGRDFIKVKEEQFARYQKILHRKFESELIGEFPPSKEQIKEWREYAAENFDLNNRLFDVIYNKFRWIKR